MSSYNQPQYETYSCEFCGNDAHYDYDCPPQVPFVYNQDSCFNQNFDYFPQTSPSYPQQYPCCEDCGGPHETFQCQPMNEDYYEQDSCYDPNSFGFDQFQPLQYIVNHPIFNAQNSLFNSQNKIMEQMTSICDMIPICYDDDEDYTIAITPVLSTEEPDNSLSMGDEHLDTILSVENLVLIPSEFEGISDDTYDVPVCEDPSIFDALSDHYEILSDSNDDGTSSDDDSYENIEYVEASPLNLEYDSLEEVNEDLKEKEFDLEDILQIEDVILREKLLNISLILSLRSPILLFLIWIIPYPNSRLSAIIRKRREVKDDILREKLLNIYLLIAKIESLNDNPTPDCVLKSPSPFPIPVEDSDSFFKKSDTSLSYSDNSLPEFETFRHHARKNETVGKYHYSC
ncbi:hypothetical protein Tco_0901600 [Tanacetum coccineum]